MSYSTTHGVALTGGISASVVRVTAEPSDTEKPPRGLPEDVARETRVRVGAAIANSLPDTRCPSLVDVHTVRRVSGTSLDLAQAVARLAAHDVAPAPADTCYCAELSLGGDLRPIRGAIVCAEAARDAGFARIVVAPSDAETIARWVDGIEVLTVRSLAHLAEGTLSVVGRRPLPPDDARFSPDYSDVRGLVDVVRQIEEAAIARRNVLLVGPPGAGKTMIARRIPSILPPLTDDERLEVARIHDVAGIGAVGVRPFRAPHHSTSTAGLVGGGTGIPRPGEISLAHHGVLFLDELPEFSRRVLDVLRVPAQTGEVVLARAWGSVRLPARPAMIVGAMNPCPCGGGTHCRCTDEDRARYVARVDCVRDLFPVVINLDSLTLDAMAKGECCEESSTIRARVAAAWGTP